MREGSGSGYQSQGTPLEPLMILLMDVTMKSHSGYEYMGLVPSAGGEGEALPHNLPPRRFVLVGVFPRTGQRCFLVPQGYLADKKVPPPRTLQ